MRRASADALRAFDGRADEGTRHDTDASGGGGNDASGGNISSMAELLDRLDTAARRHDPTSIGDVMDEVGHRSFGPLLLVAGLVMLAPGIGDIPGVPVMMGLIVILTAAQLVMGSDHVWLPNWLLRRSASRRKLQKGVRWLRPVARVLDRWSKRRLQRLTHGTAVMVGAVGCVIVAAATPLMEVVPFSANVAGIAITTFGLALIAADGLMAAFSIAFSAGTFVLIATQLL
jgi:hypothetical protein